MQIQTFHWFWCFFDSCFIYCWVWMVLEMLNLTWSRLSNMIGHMHNPEVCILWIAIEYLVCALILLYNSTILSQDSFVHFQKLLWDCSRRCIDQVYIFFKRNDLELTVYIESWLTATCWCEHAQKMH